MSFAIEVWPEGSFPARMAERVTSSLPSSGAVVITGGSTAAKVYGVLDDVAAWAGLDVLFSDERCVPPDHPESNYKMATDLFFGRTGATLHRMPGELDPPVGARRYHDEIAEIVVAGPRIAFLGMGADCHIGAIFPDSPALDDPNYCAAVDRPDGMQGITLTPTAMLACEVIDLIVTGENKAEAVARVVGGAELPTSCPARLLADHPHVTLCLDEPAARLLD